MSLSIGKIRGLQQLSDNNIFKIVAIDHRDVFVNMLRDSNKPYDTKSVIEEKLEVIKLTNQNISGYLVDPHYSLPMCIYKEVIPGNLGFMVNFEDNDYDVKNFNNEYFIKGLSINKISEMRASAVKLFFYCNPRSDYYPKQEGIIASLAEECKKISLPLLIEPVLYSIKENGDSPEEKVVLLYEMLDKLSEFDIDIFKIEFPGDLIAMSRTQNIEICQNVSGKLKVPWVIMSSGINIEAFSDQLDIACEGGASGYVVGRALWREFITAKGDREIERKQMEQRIYKLNKIAEEKAKKWTSIDGLIDVDFNQADWFKA